MSKSKKGAFKLAVHYINNPQEKPYYQFYHSISRLKKVFNDPKRRNTQEWAAIYHNTILIETYTHTNGWQAVNQNQNQSNALKTAT